MIEQTDGFFQRKTTFNLKMEPQMFKNMT